MGEPLVAVLTPVHEGADTLAACLESVQAQDYRNWLHVVVDNASTDSTRQIAESFAAREPRVKVCSFSQLLPMMENFNRALSLVPSNARYLKQLHADDTLHPDCLRKTVAAAESDPAIGVVVCRFRIGSTRHPRRAPFRAVRLPGRQVAKENLLGRSNMLGSPSIPLLRMDQLVGWPSLFPTTEFPAGHPDPPPHTMGDKECLLDTLEQTGVAYLPDFLVSLGDDDGSTTSFAQRIGAWHPARLDLLLRSGTRFMSEDELRKGVRRIVWKWIRSLAWRSFRRISKSDPEFCLHQSLCLNDLLPRLRDAGYSTEAARLAQLTPRLIRDTSPRAGS
jgi:hypothetical protein